MSAKKHFPFSSKVRRQLEAALKEDIGRGDITSELLVPREAKGTAVIVAREPGNFCGGPVIAELFRIVDPRLKVKLWLKEGQFFAKNRKVMQVSGRVRSVLKAERTVLNFLGYFSGIATRTHQFRQRVKNHPVLVLDTRKTMPLWRELAKYAVRAGGGKNHRMGLDDAILVKENHRKHGHLKKLRQHRGHFEIEVCNLKELKEALAFHPRAVLFDNFSPVDLQKAVYVARQLNPEIILEASGGVTLDNVLHYAATGVDWISIGSLTHSVKSIDFSLLIQ